MASGKSTALLEKAKEAVYAGEQVALFNWAGNTRHDDAAASLSTHDAQKGQMVATPIASLGVLLGELEATGECAVKNHFGQTVELVRDVNLIVIDEGQFFEDLRHGAETLAFRYGKRVHIAALNCKFDSQTWPSVADLIGLCTRINYHSGVCMNCGSRHAQFSMRLNDTTASVEIGDVNYATVCARCYYGRVDMDALRARRQWAHESVMFI